MSLISLLTVIVILFDVCSTFDPSKKWTRINRICREEKDYVDGSLFFGKSNYIFIGDKYYIYDAFINTIEYSEEGLQEFLIQDMDIINTEEGIQSEGAKSESIGMRYLSLTDVSDARFLGGFGIGIPSDTINFITDPTRIAETEYFTPILWHPFFMNLGLYEDYLAFEPFYDPPYDDTPINNTADIGEDIHGTGFFFRRFSNIRIFFFIENPDSLHPKYWYHIKYNEIYGLRDDTQNPLFFWNRLNSSTSTFQTRSLAIKDLLNIPELPKRPQFLPMAFDEATLWCFVIVNQKTESDKPLLYYNSFAFRQFNQTWDWVEIESGFTYTAFVIRFDERDLKAIQVMAEPFRGPSDDSRGPSYAFDLIYRNDTHRFVPRLERKAGSGMKLIFKCEFEHISNKVFVILLVIVIVFMLIVLILLIIFLCFNYFSVKRRVIVVRRKQRAPIESLRPGIGGHPMVTPDNDSVRTEDTSTTDNTSSINDN